MNFTSLENEYNALLSTMEVRPEWKDAIDRRSRAIFANKARYEEVSRLTNVPWYIIGIIHSMESGLDFNGILHNGEKIIGTGKKTKLGPKGKGPFSTWEEAAVDALKHDGLTEITDWDDEARICWALEKYNGFGYRLRRTGINTPYLWSGTNHYSTGKFVEEKKSGKIVGVYKSHIKSGQTGAIPLLRKLKEIDVPNKEIIAQSGKLSLIRRLKNLFAGFSISGFIAEWMGYLEQAKTFIVENKSAVIWGLIGTGVAVYLVFEFLQRKGVKEYKEGRYIPSGQVK